VSVSDGTEAVLDVLVPRDGPRIADRWGNEYVVPGTVSMRDEVRALRELAPLLDEGISVEAAASLRAASRSGDVLAMMQSALVLVSEDVFLGIVDRVFCAAYPDVWALVEERIGRDATPTSAFNTRSVLAVLAPFFAGIIEGALEAIPDRSRERLAEMGRAIREEGVPDGA